MAPFWRRYGLSISKYFVNQHKMYLYQWIHKGDTGIVKGPPSLMFLINGLVKSFCQPTKISCLHSSLHYDFEYNFMVSYIQGSGGSRVIDHVFPFFFIS